MHLKRCAILVILSIVILFNVSATARAATYGDGAYGGGSYSTSTLVGDLNGDGKVDILDLSILLTDWETTVKIADINNDGIVNVVDLSILLSHWTS